MRFSIRELLALAVVAALGMLAWQARQRAMEARLRNTALETEISSLESELRLDSPTWHQALMSPTDEYASIHAMRQRALQQIDLMDQKYGVMDVKEDGVFSIRSLPSIQIGDSSPATRFRMHVPHSRPVWLKFGIHTTRPNVSSSRDGNDESDLLKRSPLDVSGPFAIQLTPGEHLLEFTTGADESTAVPITIVLDKANLLQTDYVSPGAIRGGSISLAAPEQLDFPVSRQLPWLASIGLRPTDHNPGQTHYGVSVWVSERSSSFAEFPKK